MPELPMLATKMTRRSSLCLLALAAWPGLVRASGPNGARNVALNPADVVQVRDAWVRPAVAGQSGTGGYLTIEAHQAVTLTGFQTPVATDAELHEMRMAGDVMQMREVPRLPLKAGEVLTLAPGGMHLMLMGLKGALSAGSTVPLTLIFKTARGQHIEVKVEAAVQFKAPVGTPITPMGAASTPGH